ncbi:hypothetical protein Taro_037008 [Colocasia esculenta]|uniref:Bifunctional inhibitor/plant lipid transfer protein/seed storage helical domain-containing protein n=1 Tax=Colocasia esculenta TaxID=4460 RepID=A0A843WHZ2_COLES|nr:hypothetical protein [Colocasia esculenta]
MDSSRAAWLLLVVVLALSLRATPGSSEDAEICNMKESELRECEPAVWGPRPPSPTTTCCAGLGKGDLPCLCSYVDSLLPALGVDRGLALQLPAKCGLTLPSECGEAAA